MQVVNVVHEHLIKQLFVLAVLGLILVELQLLHPLLRSLGLFLRQLLLSLVFLLFGCLDRLEFLENILVMQNSVRELVTEVILSQQFLDALSNHRVPENGVDVGPLLRVHIEHSLQQIGHILTEVARHIVVLALDDFVGQLVQGLRVEGWLEGAHLIEQHSQRPDI